LSRSSEFDAAVAGGSRTNGIPSALETMLHDLASAEPDLYSSILAALADRTKSCRAVAAAIVTVTGCHANVQTVQRWRTANPTTG
jgi:hypothetical protein